MLGHCNFEEVALCLYRPLLAAPNLKTLISPADDKFLGVILHSTTVRGKFTQEALTI